MNWKCLTCVVALSTGCGMSVVGFIVILTYRGSADWAAPLLAAGLLVTLAAALSLQSLYDRVNHHNSA
jgi:hypothetical protein